MAGDNLNTKQRMRSLIAEFVENSTTAGSHRDVFSARSQTASRCSGPMGKTHTFTEDPVLFGMRVLGMEFRLRFLPLNLIFNPEDRSERTLFHCHEIQQNFRSRIAWPGLLQHCFHVDLKQARGFACVSSKTPNSVWMCHKHLAYIGASTACPHPLQPSTSALSKLFLAAGRESDVNDINLAGFGKPTAYGKLDGLWPLTVASP